MSVDSDEEEDDPVPEELGAAPIEGLAPSPAVEPEADDEERQLWTDLEAAGQEAEPSPDLEGLRRQEAERESLAAAQRLDGHGTTPSGRKLRPRLVPQAEGPTPRARRARSPSSFVEKYQVFEEDETRVQSMAKCGAHRGRGDVPTERRGVPPPEWS